MDDNSGKCYVFQFLPVICSYGCNEGHPLNARCLAVYYRPVDGNKTGEDEDEKSQSHFG